MGVDFISYSNVQYKNLENEDEIEIIKYINDYNIAIELKECDCNTNKNNNVQHNKIIDENNNGLLSYLNVYSIISKFFYGNNNIDKKEIKKKCDFCKKYDIYREIIKKYSPNIEIDNNNKKYLDNFIDYDIENYRLIYKTENTIEKQIYFSYSNYNQFINDIFKYIGKNSYILDSYPDEHNNNGILTLNNYKKQFEYFLNDLNKVIESKHNDLNDIIYTYDENGLVNKTYKDKFILFKEIIENALNNGIISIF